MTATAPPGRLDRLALHVRHPLFRNGYALVLSSGTSAVLGMAFWVLAARSYTVDVVGVNSALVAAMGLLAIIAQLNLAGLLSRFIPISGEDTARLILVCCAVTTIAALAVGGVFLIGLDTWASSLSVLHEQPGLALWFLLGLVCWCLFIMLDGALSGLRMSGWVLAKNAVYGLLKLVMLVVPVVVASTTGIFLAWTVALVPVLVWVAVAMRQRLVPAHVARAAAVSRDSAPGLLRFAAADYATTLVSTGVVSALPLVVLEMSGSASAAYFTLAWSVYYSLYLVSRSMATSLLVEGSRDVRQLGELSYRTAVQTVRILLLPVGLVTLLAPVILTAFGTEYAREGSSLLRLLALSAIPATVVAIYSAVERVRGRMLRLLSVNLAVNVGCLGLIVWALASGYDLPGVGGAWLFGQGVAALAVLVVLGPLWWATMTARAPTPVVRSASAARGLVTRRRRAGELRQALPTVAAGSGHGREWHIHDVLPTVGDVAVARVGGEQVEAVLKVARTASGSQALAQACRNVALLEDDPRLRACGWDALLPVVTSTSRTPAGRLAAVERVVDGVDGRVALTSRSSREALDEVLAIFARLHAATATPREVDESMVRAWVDRPVGVLAGIVDPDGSLGSDALRLRLREGLAGRSMLVGWTHGDLAPGNIVYRSDGGVAAVIDWERADPQGPAELDVVHLLLTTSSLRERRELGAVVCDLLAAPDEAPAPLDDPVLVLLAWLHHCVGIVAKTERHEGGATWAARNVLPVLRVATEPS